jgi:hypothetical protein
MKLVLDSGALIALAKNDRPMWRRLKAALLAGEIPATHGGVIGQAWRGRGPRAALLASALVGIEILPLDEDLGRRAGELLAKTKKSDVIDAALVLLTSDGDAIATTDAGDIKPLALASGRIIDLIEV